MSEIGPNWKAVLSGVPRKFTAEEIEAANSFDHSPAGQLFPSYVSKAGRFIGPQSIADLDTEFFWAVEAHDFEGASDIFMDMINVALRDK